MHQPTTRHRIAAFPTISSEPALPLVIDAVVPSSGGGSAPVKRVIDEPFRVEADVLADAGSVRVGLRWRMRGALRWEEKEMDLEGDFRHSAELSFSQPGAYEYAVRVILESGLGEVSSPVEALMVERVLARSAAWVALSPCPSKGGSALREFLPKLDTLKRMGFDAAILPPLGTPCGGIDSGFGNAQDFEWLVRASAQRGIEVALTLPVGDATALGYGGDFTARWEEWTESARRWVAFGVRALAIPDAHLAPVAFWRRLMAELRSASPELVFLAGSGGSRKLRAALARAGFSQSLVPLGGSASVVDLKRAVHDLHPPDLRDHGRSCLWPEFSGGEIPPAAAKARIALAALLAPAWGISERWILGEGSQASLSPFVSQLNHIRRANPVLREAGGAIVCACPHPGVLPLLRGQGRSAVLAVLNVDPGPTPIEARVQLPRASESDRLTARDLMTGRVVPWHGIAPSVELDAFSRVVRVFRMENEGEIERPVLP